MATTASTSNDNNYQRGGYRGRGRGGGGGGSHRGRGGGDNHTRIEAFARNKPVAQPIPDYLRVAFENYSSELDATHDRHERITKLDRDIRIESKRIIFLLHRFPMKQDEQGKQELLSEAMTRMNVLRDSYYLHIANDLLNVDPYKYTRAFQQGLQEFIEAYTLYHYMLEKRLVTHSEVQKYLTFNEKDGNPRMLVTTGDYLLGIGDVAGELMRYAMNSVAAGLTHVPFEVILFLREMLACASLILGMNHWMKKDYSMKVRVIRDSLQKVEWAYYVMTVRATEIPEHMLAEFIQSVQLPMSDDNFDEDS